MKPLLELDQLIEAERQIGPPANRAQQGWQRLNESLAGNGAAPASVPADGPLRLAGAGLTKKAAVLLAVVGAGAVGVAGYLGVRGAGGAAVESRERAAVVAEPSPEQSHSDSEKQAPAEPPLLPKQAQTEPPSAPSAAAPAAARRSRESSAAAAPSSGNRFDEELALIKRAKAAFDSGQTQAGLAALREHAQEFPRGVFAGEREALRVLAACGGGRSQRGRQAARRFIQAHPGSPLVDRVRRACGIDEARPVE